MLVRVLVLMEPVGIGLKGKLSGLIFKRGIAMKARGLWVGVWCVGMLGGFLAYGGEEPKPAPAQPEPTAEAKARAEYEAALKAAQEAEAALAPLRETMQKADSAYAEARAAANAKRQQATELKTLAGEEGAKMLQQAEANLANAIKALEEATKAKPEADKALEEARAAAQPVQQAYEAAEKAAQEAQRAAKLAADAANRHQIEADLARAKALSLRKAAEAAKIALPLAQAELENAQNQSKAAAQQLAEAEAQKKAAEEALANARNQLAAAPGAVQAAEKALQEAEANAKQLAQDPNKPEAEKKQAADQVAAKRKALQEARASLAKLQAAIPQLEKQAQAAAKRLADVQDQKQKADQALANVQQRITGLQGAEQAAQEAVKLADQKAQEAAQVAAKRKAIADAATRLAQAQQTQQQAQAQANATAQKVAEAEAQKKAAEQALANAKNQLVAASAAAEAAEKAAQEADAKAKQIAADPNKPEAEKKQATEEAAAKQKAAQEAKAALSKAQQALQQAEAQLNPAAQKLAEIQAQKNAADQALQKANQELAAATAAHQAAREAAKELVQLDEAAQRAAEEAAAKQKALQEAWQTLAPVRQKLEQATIQANTAAQNLARAEAQKKALEEALENLKKRIEDAKQRWQAEEEAAKQAEAAAEPLRQQAEKARAAYLEARKLAEQKRAQAERAKAALYQLLASQRLPQIMESPQPPQPANRIDEIVFAKLKSLGIQPVLCSDAVFLRRAYLDITGKLPTAEQAQAFLQDSNPQKRVALIDRLLDQPAHFDYWAMRWSDILRIKAEFPVKVWPNAAQAYHRWVWESIAQNKPYDRFARELLCSSGSNFRVGPVNFYRAIQNRTPEGIAAAVGLALMGTRVELWPKEQREQLAVFFSQVGYKPTSEWKEEIVFWDPLKSAAMDSSIAKGVDAVGLAVAATNQIPQNLPEPISPNGPLEAVFPDGTKVTIPPDRDPREVFADWLIRPENPWFAKAIVNRTWAWIMGRGIIHEPDDIRPDNPPSNPELLAYLEKEFVSSGYNLRYLKRLILTSTTYQFSSIVRDKRPEAAAHFAHYPLRRVEAEVLIDMINQITGASDLYTSAVPEPFTYIPKEMTATTIPDGSVTDAFLTLFGRSARSTGMETERVNELGPLQWLHMLNSVHIQNKIQNGPKLAALISSGQPREIAERLYLTILSRFPTETELQAAEEYAKAGVARGPALWHDIAWSLINNPEFLLRH